ncbi:YkvA family protein [uncultured Roseibium sp.]|uniref:YkvA family protein n=1 Tax=uncultured Roseibium sp. TaxID=1936171 RepID=UPI002633E6CD|nr:YkvA family protein [uncultured Roseibium sp.]
MNTTFEDLGFDPEILGPEDEQKRTIRQKLMSTARKAARQVPFMEDVIAGYFCALDPSTPTKVRATVFAALAYFVLPIDTIPDFLIGVGFGDDATVLMAAIAMIRSHMREDHYQAAREALKDGEL